jgi:putative phage-type endonuclease
MTVTEIPRPAERADWLQLRHGYANASDAAAYVGAHPFKSLADVVVEKLAPAPEETTNRAMERGNRLEAPVADWWADEHGIGVYEPDVLYANGRMLATLDRRIVGSRTDALEVKTTRHEVVGVPEYWWWQAQAQALCADLERVHFAVLDGTMDLTSFIVERDDKAIASLVEAVDRAWGFIDLGMAPEGVGFSAVHVAKMFPEAVAGKFADVDDEGLEAVVRWEQARVARLAAEKAEEEAKDVVARLIADGEGARHEGRLIATWKSTARSSLDTKRLKADLPDVVEQYQREITVRTMRAVKGLAA